MTRFLSRLFRKAARAGVIAFATATFTAPAFADDKPAILIQGTETSRITANGDGTFRYELKLPAEGYETLKATVPDAAVLLRKLGLTNQESIVSGVKGEWLDDKSTLRIDFTARGVARVGRGGAWGLPMVDGVETKLVEFKNGVATLSQSMPIPGVDGIVTSDIRMTLPDGATEVRISRDKSRLTYNLPVPSTNGKVAKGRQEIDAKRDVMASLVKVLSNRKFGTLWTTAPVGLWRTTYRVNDVFVTQTTGIEANGDIASRAEAANGFVLIRKGTLVMKGKMMHIALTDGTSHSGVVEMNGNDEFTFDDDDGPSLVYKRVK